MPITYATLENGERVGLSVLAIVGVPHISILQKRYAAIASIDTEYKHDMARLLSEVY